jgi:hypothetical protein
MQSSGAARGENVKVCRRCVMAVITRSECDDPPPLAMRAMAGLESRRSAYARRRKQIQSRACVVDYFACVRNDGARRLKDGLSQRRRPVECQDDSGANPLKTKTSHPRSRYFYTVKI